MMRIGCVARPATGGPQASAKRRGQARSLSGGAYTSNLQYYQGSTERPKGAGPN